MQKNETTSIQIPKPLHRKMKIEAARRSTTLTGLLISIIKKWLGEKNQTGDNQ